MNNSWKHIRRAIIDSPRNIANVNSSIHTSFSKISRKCFLFASPRDLEMISKEEQYPEF